MFETSASPTADLTLDAVLARLATRPEVEDAGGSRFPLRAVAEALVLWHNLVADRP